jgi:hypothetical protein
MNITTLSAMMVIKATGVVLSEREASLSGRTVAIVALLSMFLVRVAGLPRCAVALMGHRHERVSPRAGTVMPR